MSRRPRRVNQNDEGLINMISSLPNPKFASYEASLNERLQNLNKPSSSDASNKLKRLRNLAIREKKLQAEFKRIQDEYYRILNVSGADVDDD